jgi:flagellar biosynthesis protein FlhG
MTAAPIRPHPPATTIAITSGKGGVGKTSLTINLAVALARLGHRVGILDADFALGNVDVLLGLTPDHHLGAVLAGTKAVGDVTIDGPSGIRIIPAGSGVRSLTTLDELQWARLVDAVRQASRELDFLLLDTASGISDNVLDIVGLADYALVVTSYDPASVVDAYAVIKLVSAAKPEQPIGVVVNSTADADEGGVVFRQIALAAERFLGRSIRYDGHILEDAAVKRQGYQQQPFVGADSISPASRCVRRLAARLAAARPSGPGPWASRPSPSDAWPALAAGDTPASELLTERRA